MILKVKYIYSCFLLLFLISCGSTSSAWDEGGFYSTKEEQLISFAKYYTRRISKDDKNPDHYYNRADIYYDLRRFQDALLDYNKAIEIDNNNYLYYYRRGILYFSLGKNEDSLADFDHVININPYFPDVYNSRGSIYYLLGDYNNALSDLSLAIEYDDKNVLFLFNRATLYMKLGLFSEALYDGNHIIEIDRKNIDGYKILYLANFELQKFQDAKTACDILLKLEPNNARAYFSRGKCQVALGNLLEAISDYSQSIEIDSGDCEVYSHRGQAYELLAKLTSDVEEKEALIQNSIRDFARCP
jgi:tetratricopeptide (TPR) repeat protein